MKTKKEKKNSGSEVLEVCKEATPASGKPEHQYICFRCSVYNFLNAIFTEYSEHLNVFLSAEADLNYHYYYIFSKEIYTTITNLQLF